MHVLVATGLLLVGAVGCGKQRSSAAEDRAAPATPADPDRAFWSWFVDQAAPLSAHSLLDVRNQVQEQLDKAHHGVFAEIGLDGDDRLLVLTADGDPEVFPAVQHLFAARPVVKGWKIVAFRRRETTHEMPAIELNGHRLERTALRYVAARNDDKLDIQLYIPGYTEGDKAVGSMAFLALDHTVGEYDVETKLGVIDLLPIDRAPPSARPLDDLPAQVDALDTSPPR